jgi:hypothetical protein
MKKGGQIMYFFTTGTILKKLFEEQGRISIPKDRLLLFKAMLKLKTIYATDIDENWGKKIYQNYQIRINTKYEDKIREIATNPSVVLDMPAGVYLLNLDFSKINNLKTDYGTLAISMEDNKSNAQFYLYLSDRNIEFSPENSEVYHKGWNTVLNDLITVPSSAIIFIDRYLFNLYVEGTKQNIRDVLEQLLPKSFSKDYQYHVSFIFDLNALSEKPFEDLSMEITSAVKTLRPNIKMQVELIGISNTYKSFYRDIHNRRIISDYYIVRADNSLRAYRQPTNKKGDALPGAIFNKSNCLQTLTPQRLFTMNSLDAQSDAPVRSINTTIKSIQEFSGEMQKMEKTELKDGLGRDYIYSLNGEVMDLENGIQNRLII